MRRYNTKSNKDLWLEISMQFLGNLLLAFWATKTRGLKNKKAGKMPVSFVNPKNKLINHLFFILNTQVFLDILKGFDFVRNFWALLVFSHDWQGSVPYACRN